MNRPKIALIATTLSCLVLLVVALYLQLVEKMLPCPLCVMQRYAFIAIALSCLITLALPAALRRIGLGLGLLSVFSGIGIAGYHLWVLANPEISCGIDPLETGLNKIFLSRLLPVLFKADGLCDTPYAPILGLSIPAWAMVWFLIFAVILSSLFFGKKRERELFGKNY
ncbi:MAG: disulfide bond formation protein B [Undibacterium sp.]|uniref:disulfide bond formation protein B n=1 Tax=Undibacterium sp. TaxID=1914977 RepID=UPI00271F7E3D|nr:disulfide bond formation protein B [Undibacterium sp.]MDO8654599.1 disulfide bond formation protein B [Undibacterium sp.]